MSEAQVFPQATTTASRRCSTMNEATAPHLKLQVPSTPRIR